MRNAIIARTKKQPSWVRTLAGAVLLALLVPLMFFMATSSAQAADDDEKDKADYSLYKLGSTANTYFAEKSSPENGGQPIHGSWQDLYKSPAQAGSMLGYADDGNWVNWLFSTVSGSSHSVEYSAFDGKAQDMTGMKSYAQFGAANADLGLDKMYSAAGFDPIIRGVGGALMWLVYILAIGVGLLFWGFIQILQFMNPFLWFHKGLAAVSPAYKTFADGMVTTTKDGLATVHAAPSGLSGLESFIADWYGTLVSLSWDVLVPLFIGFLMLGLVFFKKMDRGSAFKKIVVRVLFLAFGLPLFGGMYTSILTQFSEDLGTQNSGPTQVVASTYVDFENWMNKNRLHVPDNASITWDPSTGHALPISTFSVRNTALAINKQVHSGAFANLDVAAKDKNSSASAVWANTPSINGDDAQQSDAAGAGMVIDMLWRYMTPQTVKASDFESKIQGSISDIPKENVAWDTKKAWFLGQSYKTNQDHNFGEGENPVAPSMHPLFATKGTGLTATPVDGGGTSFTSGGVVDCGSRVVEPGSATPGDCNLAPMAAYNYQNTEFNADSMTIYSSNRSASGFTRTFHASVAQVGTGASAFMYWANAFVLLLCIAILGIFYGLGMLSGSLKRGFSTIAAVPFATMGSIASIAKVVIYSTAMILEVLVTVFLYQFVSKLLISMPQIIENPIANLLKPSSGDFVNVLASSTLGPVLVVIMTLVSILLILGITIMLMRVRGSVLKAMDEAVTKLVDRFLETTTPAKPSGGTGSGLLPAIASGAVSGAGMAAGDPLRGRIGGGASQPNGAGKTGDNAGSGRANAAASNAGGLNGPSALESNARRKELGSGSTSGALGREPIGGLGGPAAKAKALSDGSGSGGVNGVNGADGAVPDGSGPGSPGDGSTSGSGRGSTAAHGTTINPSDSAGQGWRSMNDRQLAQKVIQQGGLTDLGVGTVRTGGKTTGGDRPGSQPRRGQRLGKVSSPPSQRRQTPLPRNASVSKALPAAPSAQNAPTMPAAERTARTARVSRPRTLKTLAVPTKGPVTPDDKVNSVRRPQR